jgi:probable phosphoglycerate mutase
MDLILARHGESEANVIAVFSNTGFKHPLTPLGQSQAHDLAARLRARYGAIAHVFCSPLQRAVETAQIVAADLDVAHTIHPGLVEFSVGALEGRSDPEAWQAFSRVWTAWFDGHDSEARLEGGESLSEIVARLRGCIADLQADPHCQGSLPALAIGHGGTFLAALPFLGAGIDHAYLSQYRFGNCDYLRLSVTGDAIALAENALSLQD